MKRFLLLVLSLILLVSIISCIIRTRQDEVLDSLGKYENKQIWTNGGFQDYTDFGRYTFSSVNIENNNYFTGVSESDVETICSFIDNFEGLIESIRNNNPNDDLVLNYSFDRSIIDTTDYFYIYEDAYYPKYGCYDVWFFDTQTNVLYFFHNNI